MYHEGKVAVKVGSTLAWVRPENAEVRKAELERASKVPTVKAARAAALKGGVTRRYPKFKEGMTVAEYTRQYTMLNARQSGSGIMTGTFLAGSDILREQGWIANFFQPLSTRPLSTRPMFTPDDTVVEEII